MKALRSLVVLATALLRPDFVLAAEPAGESPCVAAAAQAEAERGLPPGLLTAIGRIESGRWNPVSQRTEPWPWTVNAAGSGRYLGSAEEAIENVRREQAYGTRSVDVGCFQISLLHHPMAFATLAEAFDPLTNARYAAQFLQTLQSTSGSWETAAGQYHSATPGLGEPYRAQVIASWKSGGQGRGPSVLVASVARPVSLVGNAGRQPSGPVSGGGGGDPHVIMVQASGAAMRVEHGPAFPDAHVITFSRLSFRRGT